MRSFQSHIGKKKIKKKTIWKEILQYLLDIINCGNRFCDRHIDFRWKKKKEIIIIIIY